MDIFNRQSASLFSHPGFQPCTGALIELFAMHKSPSEILAYLCSTLLRIPEFTALHIVPTTRQISSRHTPFPETEVEASSSRPTPRGTYRADGVGAIYGKHVSGVADPVKDLRRAVKNLPQAWQIDDDITKGIDRKRIYSDWDKEGNVRYVRQAWKEELKPKPKYFKVEQYKRRKEPEIKGDPKWMLVRMLDDGWDKLTWNTSVKVLATQGDASYSTQIRAKSGRSIVDDLVHSAKSTPSGPFRPLRTSSPASSPPSESPASTIKIPSLNPFRTTTASRPTGIRPLSLSQSQSESQIQSSPMPDEECSFAGSQKKRRFGGAESEEKKRAGMRMFTVKRYMHLM